ncbi:MAG: type II secretion system major pseudopilin GspG [Phycisphaeraceae bacterium]
MNTTESQTSPLNPARRRALAVARRGFTLIEVLLVIVIIGMLATVLIFTVGGKTEGARIDTTNIAIKRLANAAEEFNLHTGAYPPDLDSLLKKPADEKLGSKWRGPYIDSAAQLNDSWNNKFNYELMEAGAQNAGTKRFHIWSNGPDGQNGSEDDLKNWTTEGT